jgi:RNA polymerase sigma-70 factor (ECF subfamily)
MTQERLSSITPLLAAARSGSREALGQLLEVFRPCLLALAQRELPADLRAKADPSDLVQETFAAAHRSFPQFTGQTEGELLAWLQRILRHVAINFAICFRGTGKRQIGREVSLNDSRWQGQLGRGLCSADSSPSDAALRNEEAEALERAFKQLPEDYRQVVVLHHGESRTFEETARLMKRSEAAVRKLWARALDRLRREVKALYGLG